MGRGNARFGCPKGTYRISDHSALHYHVYVDYGDINEQDEFDNLRLEITNYIKSVCSSYSMFEYPENKWLDRETKVIAESTSYGIAVAGNEWSDAVFVYAKESEESEEFLTQGIFYIACRLFWEMRHLKLRQRTCSWTSREYQGIPTPT